MEKKWLVDAIVPGAVEAETAVIRLVGSRVLGGAFWLVDAGGGLNTTANVEVAAVVAFAGRGGAVFFLFEL